MSSWTSSVRSRRSGDAHHGARGAVLPASPHLRRHTLQGVSRDRRLVIAAALNVVIVVVQIIYGIRAKSLGLIADAGHNLTDVAALALSWWAVVLVRRSPTAKQSFGFHRSGILAAQANAAMILIATAFIVYEGVQRLVHPTHVKGLVVVVVAGIGLVVNGVAALTVNDHSGDLNMRSAVLHMLGDAAASAGVVLAGVVILVRDGSERLDPAVSIAIGLYIAWRAVKLLMATTDILMEATPSSIDMAALRGAMRSADGVESVHDVHAWSLSGDLHALSAHLVLGGHPTLEEAQVVGERVKHILAEHYAISHATLELECEPCADHDIDCVPVPVASDSARAHHH